VRTLPSGQTQLLIGLHLIHEVTTPQAFQMLKELNLKCACPSAPSARSITSFPRGPDASYADPEAEEMAQHMYRNMKDSGSRSSTCRRQAGIVHVIGRSWASASRA